jgi:hypothetical protein
MDVISMQIANKVLRRMNTEFNGVYDKFVATAGQKTFTTTKVVATDGNALKVFVDGILAVKDIDYTVIDSRNIQFINGLEAGAQVLLTTDVVGVPKFEMVAPAYDDTQVKADINSLATRAQNSENAIFALQTRVTNAESEINNIKSVLDEDGDGSITDTIANIKAQWESADGNLTNLINNKAEQSDLEAVENEIAAARGLSSDLATELNAIKSSIPAAYDDSALSDRVADIEDEISTARATHASIGERIQAVADQIPVTEVAAIKNEIEAARGGKNNLSEKLSEIQLSIPEAYDDSDLSQRVTALESKKLDEFVLVDTVTGYEYKIKVINGVLTADLLKKLASVTVLQIGTGNIYKGDTVGFTATAKFEDNTDATSNTLFVYSVDNETIATINPSTGVLTALDEGNVIVSVTGTAYGVSKSNNIAITIILTDSQAVEKAKTNLDLAAYNSLPNLDAIIGNLVMPATMNGTTVTWSSDNVSVIANDGTVVRPSGLDGNAVVTLTATISKGTVSDTKTFVATVIALPLTDAEKVQIAKANLTLGDTSAVISDLTLPNTQNEATVTWVSSDPTVVSDTGVVTRPAAGSGDATVTLTATITVNSASDTKEFTVTVLQEE